MWGIKIKKTLLDVLFKSEKRKNVLLLLHEGPMDMENILNSLGTTRQSLLPQMKVLEDNHLIFHYEDIYELAPIGKLIVEEMIPLLDTIEVFDGNVDYWGTHHLDFIPPHLFGRISEIGKCDVLSPPISEAYEICRKFHESTRHSSYLHWVSEFIHPTCVTMFTDLFKRNIAVHKIISNDLYNKLRTQDASDFKRMLENDLFHLYVYPEKMHLMTFAYNDYHLMIDFLKDNGEYDTKYILCDKPNALKWGKELFEWYLKDSIPVTEI